jgi:hypothetical protein
MNLLPRKAIYLVSCAPSRNRAPSQLSLHQGHFLLTPNLAHTQTQPYLGENIGS